MTKNTLIIIPAHNEAENIGKVIKDIRTNFCGADILVINDASTDNTEEILRANNVLFVSNIFNLGYARSLQTGIKYAFRENYDYVIQMDGDGQHLASEAKKLYEYANNHDSVGIVIGSRYLRKTSYNCPFFRRFGTKLFELTIQLFCKKRIRDPLSGFQCLNRKVINEYAHADFYPEYPDANLLMEMLYKRYKIAEVPVEMKKREHGTSMHSGIIKPIKYMVHMFYAVILVAMQNIRRSRTDE